MDSFDDNNWGDYLDYDFINETTVSSDFLWPNNNNNKSSSVSGGVENDFKSGVVTTQVNECPRKRGRGDIDTCSDKAGNNKARRERLRRERLNDRFQDLSNVLEPGRPAKADKPVILDDAIKILNQLKTEAQELKETNERLQDEIKSLKAEKNELREEKQTLKVDKERMEQQLKAMANPQSGFMPSPPTAIYHPGPSKMAIFPGYGLVPMWQYLPPSTCDTSHDHELRPPAA